MWYCPLLVRLKQWIDRYKQEHGFNKIDIEKPNKNITNDH